jgi:hypothetical protein
MEILHEMRELELREVVAGMVHHFWRHWMVYQFGRSRKNRRGQLVIPPDLAERWERQAHTCYEQLLESEKESDRVLADELIAVLHSAGALAPDLPVQPPEDIFLYHTPGYFGPAYLLIPGAWGETPYVTHEYNGPEPKQISLSASVIPLNCPNGERLRSYLGKAPLNAALMAGQTGWPICKVVGAALAELTNGWYLAVENRIEG